MSNVLVEGFGTYGLGTGTAVTNAMLAGVWAQIHSVTIGQLPWDAENLDTYMICLGTTGFAADTRRVLPSALAKVRVSLYYALPTLPSGIYCRMMQFLDVSGLVIAELRISATGAIQLFNGAGQTAAVLLASSSGPVIVAETATHLEMELNRTTGTFKLYANDTLVINASGLVFSNGTTVGILAFVPNADTNVAPPVELINHYFSHLIVRDDAGSYNNTFPIGDRKVATLFPNLDDAAQGWTAQPLRRFGVGVLNLTTSTTAGVYGPNSIATNLGSGDFTIEGQFRLQSLPTGSAKAVLFGKWGEALNQRSYELYLGGPSLETGLLVFRTSTDGQSGTVVEKLKWAWTPAVGHWYHIAVSRESGVLRWFIDGVQIGIDVADTDVYFAGTNRPAIGVEMNATAAVANTHWMGWQDEFRLTVGASRYNANFSPPTEGFARGVDDPDWADVAWLSSWDNGSLADDGPNGITLTAVGSAAALTPGDGDFAYQTIDKDTPDDDTFIEAALISATGIFTLTAVPSAAETVTVGTKDGSTAAVYKFVAALVAAFDVLIGADVGATMSNLVAAVNHAAGEGTTYGTGTTANADVSAVLQPSNQMQVSALTPGTAGNAIASTDTAAAGSWTAATLAGGLDIPGYSQFGLERMPSGTTIVDSVTFATRQWKSDAGTATTQVSLVGSEGGVISGDARVVSTVPTVYFDTIEADPDGGGLTPTTILSALARVDRTA